MQESAFFAGTRQPAAGVAVTSGALPVSSGTSSTSSKRHIPPATPAALAAATRGSLGAPRGLRFPSSRLYLWDRTSSGPQVLLDLKDAVPHVYVASNTFAALQKAAAQGQPTAQLQLRLSISSTNAVTALIQAPDHLSGGSGLELLPFSCQLRPRPAQDAVLGTLVPLLQAHLDQKGAATLSQLYALSGWASSGGSSSSSGSSLVQLSLVQPATSLLMTPLFTKRLCAVPLSHALLAPGHMPPWQTGYLSMDQARSLLPLAADDSQVFSVPLVGVWVKGPSSPCHPLVAAACLKFTYTHVLLDRAMQRDSSFLLLLCPEGEPMSKCYEVLPTHPLQLPIRSLQLSLSGSAAAPAPDQSTSTAWVADPVPPDPLAYAQPDNVQQEYQQQHVRAGISSSSWQVKAGSSSSLQPGGASHTARYGATSTYSSSVSSLQGAPGPLAPLSMPQSSVGAAGGSSSGLGRPPRAAGSAMTRSWPSHFPPRGPSPAMVQSPLGLTRPQEGFHAAGAPGDDAAPEPRTGAPPGPYGSPVPRMSGGAAGGCDADGDGYGDADDTPEERWVKLGHDLLAGPHGARTGSRAGGNQQDSAAQLYSVGPCDAALQQHQSAAQEDLSMPAPAPDGLHHHHHHQQAESPGGRKWSEQHEQALRGSLGNASAAISDAMAALEGVTVATGVEAAIGAEAGAPFGPPLQQDMESSPQLGSPVKAGRRPAAAAHCTVTFSGVPPGLRMADEAGGKGAGSAAGGDGSFEPHALRPTSPPVAADLAMSHLSLLHHLSTGNLQAALHRVASPTRSASPQGRSRSPSPGAANHGEYSGPAAADPGSGHGSDAASGVRLSAQAFAAAGSPRWAPSPTHRLGAGSAAGGDPLRGSLEVSAAATYSAEAALAAAEAAMYDIGANSSPGRRRFAQQLQVIHESGAGHPASMHTQPQQPWLSPHSMSSAAAGFDGASRSSLETAQQGLASAAAALDAAAAGLAASSAAHGGLAAAQLQLQQQQQQEETAAAAAGGMFGGKAGYQQQQETAAAAGGMFGGEAGYQQQQQAAAAAGGMFGGEAGYQQLQLSGVLPLKGVGRWPGVSPGSDYSDTPDSLQAEVMKLKAELAALQEQLHLASQPYVVPQHMLQPLTPPAALALPAAAAPLQQQPGDVAGVQAGADHAADAAVQPQEHSVEPEAAVQQASVAATRAPEPAANAAAAAADAATPVAAADAEGTPVGAEQGTRGSFGGFNGEPWAAGSEQDLEATLAFGMARSGAPSRHSTVSGSLQDTVAGGSVPAADAVQHLEGTLPPPALLQQQLHQQGASSTVAHAGPSTRQSWDAAAAVETPGQSPALASTFYRAVDAPTQKAAPVPRSIVATSAVSSSNTGQSSTLVDTGRPAAAAAAAEGRGHDDVDLDSSSDDDIGVPAEDGVELLRRSAEGRWAAIAAGSRSSVSSSLRASADAAERAGSGAAAAAGGAASVTDAVAGDGADSTPRMPPPAAGRGSTDQGLRTSQGLRASQLQVVPLPEVVRTVYEPLSDSEGDSDAEFEQQLLRKYGLSGRV